MDDLYKNMQGYSLSAAFCNKIADRYRQELLQGHSEWRNEKYLWIMLVTLNKMIAQLDMRLERIKFIERS